MLEQAVEKLTEPWGQVIESTNLTKTIQASIFAPGGRQGIASAGLVSTRTATILAPSFIRILDGTLFAHNGFVATSLLVVDLRRVICCAVRPKYSSTPDV